MISSIKKPTVKTNNSSASKVNISRYVAYPASTRRRFDVDTTLFWTSTTLLQC